MMNIFSLFGIYFGVRFKVRTCEFYTGDSLSAYHSRVVGRWPFHVAQRLIVSVDVLLCVFRTCFPVFVLVPPCFNHRALCQCVPSGLAAPFPRHSQKRAPSAHLCSSRHCPATLRPLCFFLVAEAEAILKTDF